MWDSPDDYKTTQAQRVALAHCHVNMAHPLALPRPSLLGAGLSWHPGGQTIRWYKGDEATGWGGGTHVVGTTHVVSHLWCH